MNDNESGIQKALVDKQAKFNSLAESITEGIESLMQYLEVLEECKIKMGTQGDTKSMRTRMKTEISEANDLIKNIMDQLQEVEDVKFKNRKENDNKNKMLRRLNNTFEEYYDKFTKLIKEIHGNEKKFIDIKQSVFDASSFSEMTATVNSEGHAMQKQSLHSERIALQKSTHEEDLHYDQGTHQPQYDEHGNIINNNNAHYQSAHENQGETYYTEGTGYQGEGQENYGGEQHYGENAYQGQQYEGENYGYQQQEGNYEGQYNENYQQGHYNENYQQGHHEGEYNQGHHNEQQYNAEGNQGYYDEHGNYQEQYYQQQQEYQEDYTKNAHENNENSAHGGSVHQNTQNTGEYDNNQYNEQAQEQPKKAYGVTLHQKGFNPNSLRDSGIRVSVHHLKELKESIKESTNNLEFYESIIKQRESQIGELKKIGSVVALDAEPQVEEPQYYEPQRDVGIVINETANSNVEGNQSEVKATKERPARNNAMINKILAGLIGVVIIGLVIVLFVLN